MTSMNRLISGKADESTPVVLKDPHLLRGAGVMLPRKMLNFRSPEGVFPTILGWNSCNPRLIWQRRQPNKP